MSDALAEFRTASAADRNAWWRLDDGDRLNLFDMALDALDEARKERDLAIAHDRQPYPTAWAYEQACKALETHRVRADKAEAALEVAQRPPLGYVVLTKRVSRNDPAVVEYGAAGSIWPEVEPVENHQAYCQVSAEENPEKYQRNRPVEYVIAELREVHP